MIDEPLEDRIEQRLREDAAYLAARKAMEEFDEVFERWERYAKSAEVKFGSRHTDEAVEFIAKQVKDGS